MKKILLAKLAVVLLLFSCGTTYALLQNNETSYASRNYSVVGPVLLNFSVEEGGKGDTKEKPDPIKDYVGLRKMLLAKARAQYGGEDMVDDVIDILQSKVSRTFAGIVLKSGVFLEAKAIKYKK